MQRKQILLSLIFVLFLTGCFNPILFLAGCFNPKEYIYNKGFVFGTVYHFTYESSEGDLHSEIRELLASFNRSLSTFDTTSIISRFNKGEDNVVADSLFLEVFAKAEEVSRETGGAFDMTIAPIVNAWGFGFEKYETINDELIDSLMQFVGMDNVYIENGIIRRKKDGIMLNVSAIAKGYGVDIVASYLKNRGIENYMVEIGGEISAGGVNPKGNLWRVGIDKPMEDPTLDNREYKLIIQLSDKAMATSGNYRNYYIKDGIKYAHTIDPHTGYPVEHSILSASIIANDCMTADAYATACMVIGLEEAMALIERLPDIEGCFIYQLTEGGIMGIAYTDGFEEYVVNAF